MGAAGRRQPAVQFLEGATGPHGGHDGRQAATGEVVVVDVVGGHRRDPGRHGQPGQSLVPACIDGVAVVPELYGHPVSAEPGHQVVEDTTGSRRTIADEGGGYSPLATACEHHPGSVSLPSRSLVQPGQHVEGEPRMALAAGQLRLGDGSTQAGVPVRPLGQHHQMVAGRIRGTGAG